MSTKVPPRGGGKRPSNRPGTANRKGKQAAFAARKRQQRLIAMSAIVVVVAVVAVIIGIKVGGGGSSSSGGRAVASAQVVGDVTGLSPATMARAAKSLPISQYPKAITGPPLTANGQPEMLYIGAEYCPYCAGERWAMVAALSKFGTFSHLGTVTSSAQDTVASVPTFTFYGSTYTSPYLTFTPVETQTTNPQVKLETMTSAQQKLLTTYDAPPYVAQQSSGGIPFIDLGGKSILAGASYDDSALQHQSVQTVASDVAQQSTRTAGLIAATAGVITSHLCQLTGGKSLNNACAAFPTPING